MLERHYSESHLSLILFFPSPPLPPPVHQHSQSKLGQRRQHEEPAKQFATVFVESDIEYFTAERPDFSLQWHFKSCQSYIAFVAFPCRRTTVVISQKDVKMNHLKSLARRTRGDLTHSRAPCVSTRSLSPILVLKPSNVQYRRGHPEDKEL